MSKEEIGCCGAYCGTCKAYLHPCKGCKIGYDNGARDIDKARCAMKICCIKHGYCTCADCEENQGCAILNGFYQKNGYKYGKYKEAVDYIKKNGYEAYLDIAKNWKNASGKY